MGAKRWVLSAFLFVATGCEGLTNLVVQAPTGNDPAQPGVPSGDPTRPGEAPGDPTQPGALPGDPTQPGGIDGPVTFEPELPADSSRLPRLTHNEYRQTVADLLFLSRSQVDQLTAFLLGDPQTSLFPSGDELSVSSALWQDYQRAAEALATAALPDTAALSRLAGTTVNTGPAFVTAFGRRAFRRPLSSAEVNAYASVFSQAPQWITGVPSLVAGARLVTEAMLQSPKFLYRAELSSGNGAAPVTLSAHEVAARLSYGLWDTMPDAALSAAADSGDLLTPQGYAQQLDRVIADPRTKATVTQFHALMLDSSKLADITRSTALFPEWTNALRTSMVAEQSQFVQHVVFDEGGGLKALLTAPYTFVDANLAAVYKVPPPNTGFIKTVFGDQRRAGLLTQVGFLTVNASSTQSDPIHRGVFINRQIICRNLPPPPNDIPPLPPDDPNVKTTMRQKIDKHTGAGTCGASCHGEMINPAGFAFEHYDALGRWRDLDNGLPVDAAASYNFQGTRKAFNGAVQFAAILSEEPWVHECYAQNWLEFIYGRSTATTDRGLLGRVAHSSRQSNLPIRDVMKMLANGPTFLTRPF